MSFSTIWTKIISKLKTNCITILNQIKEEEEEEEFEAEQLMQIKQIIEEDNVELLQKETEEVHLKQIIEKDNLELLQHEFENNKNIILKDSFFEEDEMQIPILHYCVMKKAMKCFKFLILNGADPSQTLSDETENNYEWDCISIAVCFGEWEMMKILEERGIDKLNNPNVWEAAALTHRNKFLKLLISNNDQINNFEDCLNQGLLGATKGNNLKGVILLISKGADINAKDIIYHITINHF